MAQLELAQLQLAAVVVPAAPGRGRQPRARIHRPHLIPAPLPRRSGMTGRVLRPEKLLLLPVVERRLQAGALWRPLGDPPRSPQAGRQRSCWQGVKHHGRPHCAAVRA